MPTTPRGAVLELGEPPAWCCQCPLGTYNLIWPVERALAIQSRSSVLKGTSTKLTLAGRFLALSGYMKWCVVRPPTSPSKPTVGAWFILGREQGRWHHCPNAPCLADDTGDPHKLLNAAKQQFPAQGRGKGWTHSHSSQHLVVPASPHVSVCPGGQSPGSALWLSPHHEVVPVDFRAVTGAAQVA